MKRRDFIQNTALATTGVMFNKVGRWAAPFGFPEVRTPLSERKFNSKAVENAISTFKANVKDAELGWLFNNCFPNTLDTTVFHEIKNGIPDTYVITGDIDAMWLRDSSAQVWPYLQFIRGDEPLKDLIAGVIYRQTRCILKDPYANAFYKDENKKSEWAKDHTDMKPGVHERKWEIDSLCYPIRLAYKYWKETGDTKPFGGEWKKAIESTYTVFRLQQRKEGLGPYHFQRTTSTSTDTQPMSGYGYPVKPVGLICSMFRPSDDATLFSFLVPSNFFAVVSLRQAAEMVTAISKDKQTAGKLLSLAAEVEKALHEYAIVDHHPFGKVYAYEVNGVKATDPVYQNTRRLILSKENPFFYKGKAGEGIGGPHVGADMIWPIAITMRGLTSNHEKEIEECIQMLKKTHAGTGFMHESFFKDDPAKFTRKWFAWANTLFGEFLWKTYQKNGKL